MDWTYGKNRSGRTVKKYFRINQKEVDGGRPRLKWLEDVEKRV